MSPDESTFTADAKYLHDPSQSGITKRLRSLMRSHFAVNPRFLRVMIFILFDSIVIGELVLWNAYLVYVMVFGLQMNDFGKFYYSAVAYLRGGEMYGPSPATLFQLDGPNLRHFWNLNPPHFHIPLLGLAWLRPELAIVVWGFVSLACLALSWIVITNETGIDLRSPWRWRLAVVGALLFAGTGATFLTGQLSFPLLLIVTMCWIHARHGRWDRAGIFLGIAVSLKPFLLIIVPYLVLKRRFRAILSCTLAVIACFGAGLLVFGFDVHLSWLRAISASSDWTWASMNASVLGFLSRALDMGPHFTPMVNAPHLVKPFWLIAAGIIFVLTMATTVIRPHTFSLDRDFALLLVAALLISPLGWVYYLWLPLGPVIGLVAASSRYNSKDWIVNNSGKLRWRNGLLLGGMLLLFVPLYFADPAEPNRWETVLLGSSYFWGTLALWCVMFLDWSTQSYFRKEVPLCYDGTESQLRLERT